MIRIGDTPLTVFIGAAPVEGLYIGPVKIYPDREPVITIEYSAWVTQSLSLSASPVEIPAWGGSATISAVTHQVRTKTTLADGVPIATEQETQNINVTPSLSSNNVNWAVSGTTVSCGSRGTVAGGQLSAIITGTYDGAAGATTLYQQANQPVSYAYQVVAVSGGGTIAWGGGSTTVTAKSQRKTTYTSGATSGYEDTTGQYLTGQMTGGSAFSIKSLVRDGVAYVATIQAGATSSTSQRTSTLTFIGSVGGSLSVTVRQDAMPYYGEFRYTGTNQASKYPRCAVNGTPDQTRQYYSYWEALKSTNGNQVTYHEGTCVATQGTGDIDPYIFFGYDGGWSVNGLGFKSGQQINFVQNYPYTYTTVSFNAVGMVSSGWSHGPLPGIALFEKSYGDYAYGWPPSSMFSAPEARAMSLLAENGTVTAADAPELAEVDFAALSEKINNLRVPDTNKYILNEDGTWTVVESDS